MIEWIAYRAALANQQFTVVVPNTPAGEAALELSIEACARALAPLLQGPATGPLIFERQN